MRGTGSSSSRHNVSRRIIPAYAGNRTLRLFSFSSIRDHPRVCGEQRIVRVIVHLHRGSSPRMRGTGSFLELRTQPIGIIPAYAGNRSRLRRREDTPRDHPRVCGEQVPIFATLTRMLGSSPRMRGTEIGPQVVEPQAGIIPAYAGNRNWYTGGQTNVRDHPRVCGEQDIADWEEIASEGSSPRMRGTASGGSCVLAREGIIPAYAGNSSCPYKEQPAQRDHPRVCGEQNLRIAGIVVNMGSSPRMRGTGEAVNKAQSANGIIPAYAGNSGVDWPCATQSRDHPRVCGEQT